MSIYIIRCKLYLYCKAKCTDDVAKVHYKNEKLYEDKVNFYRSNL